MSRRKVLNIIKFSECILFALKFQNLFVEPSSLENFRENALLFFKMFIYNMIHDVSYQLVCDYFIHVLRTMLKNKISVYFRGGQKERAIFYDGAENQRTHTQQAMNKKPWTFPRVYLLFAPRCKKSVRDCVSPYHIGNSNTYCVANQKFVANGSSTSCN